MEDDISFIEAAAKEILSESDVTKLEKFFELRYYKELVEVVREYPERKSIIVDYWDLDRYDADLADKLLNSPEEVISAAKDAIKRLDLGIKDIDINVRFTNLPESCHVRIKDIRSEHLGKLIVVEGIIKTISEVRPECVEAVFRCPSCNKKINVKQDGRRFLEPQQCDCGRKGRFLLEENETKYLDGQRIRMQEPPEVLEGSEQPSQIYVHLVDDLVSPRERRKIMPGNRIKVVGIVKKVQEKSPGNVKTPRYDIYIEANYIEPVEREFEEIELTREDIEKIKELSQYPNLYDLLVESIAPTIYGYKEIKEAILLQLFGGVPKIQPDGTRIRGDIHIFLIGDPGTAKSQLLRYIANLAPKGRYVSGKAATTAGLTVTLVKDEFVGGWTLEAGALVLANKGIVCVDEFEKMSKEDRSALHEAMEQQSYHKDFEIMLADGSKVRIGEFIDDLMERYKDFVIKGKDTEILYVNNIYVMAYDISKKDIAVCKADRISRHKAPDKFVRIEFENGRSIMVTPEHPMLVWKGDNIETIRADRLKEGMLTVGVRKYKLEPVGASFDESMGNPYYGLQTITSCAEPAFGCPHIHLALGDFNYLRCTTPRVSVEIDAKLDKLKRVPRFVFNNKEKIRFIKSLFEKYGCVVEDKIVFRTSSRLFAEDLQDFLLFLGIYSRIEHDERDYKVVVSEAYSTAELSKILANVHGYSKRKRNYESSMKGNMRFLKVKKVEVIENKGSKWVYDITVEPYHLFVSHGLVLHNTISVAKAGIVTTLKAETAILAAANPKYGRFDRYRPLYEQTDIGPTLLSRFDLKFPLLDVPKKDRDEKLAEHIIKAHANPSYIKPPISPEFLRKYIAYARKVCKPKLSDEAIEEIKNFYVNLRNSYSEEAEAIVPLTPRQLEALIRLAEASAKVRLSNVVTKEDAQRAIRLLEYSLKLLGTEPETGKIDIDRIDAAMSSSQRSKVATILEIVDDLGKNREDGIPVEEIVEEAKNRGLRESDVYELIDKLKIKGDLWEPKPGFIRKI